jgi:predicted unusual protein kinase regulating ubiquinone biosynthesis (AarF/ABC1/UbiB family)
LQGRFLIQSNNVAIHRYATTTTAAAAAAAATRNSLPSKMINPVITLILWGIGGGGAGGCILASISLLMSTSTSTSTSSAITIKNTSRCDARIGSVIGDHDNDADDTNAAISPTTKQQEQDASTATDTMSTTTTTVLSKVKRAIRVVRRIIKLMIVFTPVAVLYPLHWMIYTSYQILIVATTTTTPPTNAVMVLDTQELVLNSLGDPNDHPGGGWYYRILLQAVELSGAALIKIMQWAGSRPDMFGPDFCAVFSQLQDDTTPHAWKYTEQALIDAYGEDWRDHIELGDILGSGCIAQVYKGYILTENNNATLLPKKRPVAIKVMHPHVEEDIDADLDILRVTVRLMEYLNFGPLKDLKWLNLPGFIEEMADMLKIQLDLTTEGKHLVQFNHNFEGNDTVIFPKLIQEYPPVKNVLVETFCEGVPIMDFIKNNKADRELLTNMCTGAIRAVCQMIFLGKSG